MSTSRDVACGGVLSWLAPGPKTWPAREASFVWRTGGQGWQVRFERTGYLLSGCDETEMHL